MGYKELDLKSGYLKNEVEKAKQAVIEILDQLHLFSEKQVSFEERIGFAQYPEVGFCYQTEHTFSEGKTAEITGSNRFTVFCATIMPDGQVLYEKDIIPENRVIPAFGSGGIVYTKMRLENTLRKSAAKYLMGLKFITLPAPPLF